MFGRAFSIVFGRVFARVIAHVLARVLAVAAAFTDSTVDLRCESEDHFFTCVTIDVIFRQFSSLIVISVGSRQGLLQVIRLSFRSSFSQR